MSREEVHSLAFSVLSGLNALFCKQPSTSKRLKLFKRFSTPMKQRQHEGKVQCGKINKLKARIKATSSYNKNSFTAVRKQGPLGGNLRCSEAFLLEKDFLSTRSEFFIGKEKKLCI